jgi:hypothetical protein
LYRTVSSVTDPLHNDADMDPSFRFDAQLDTDRTCHIDANPDQDPAPHQSDANLRPTMVNRPSTASF